MKPNKRAFTIMEVIIVVVLVGLMIGFALPNYLKANQKNIERAARANLIIIRSAVKFYLNATKTTALPVWNNLNQINAGLGLSIINNNPNLVYSCAQGTDECRVTNTAGGWTIHFHGSGHNTDRSLHCSAGTCPACPVNPGNCG